MEDPSLVAVPGNVPRLFVGANFVATPLPCEVARRKHGYPLDDGRFDHRTRWPELALWNVRLPIISDDNSKYLLKAAQRLTLCGAHGAPKYCKIDLPLITGQLVISRIVLLVLPVLPAPLGPSAP